jgi:hypothetical protein
MTSMTLSFITILILVSLLMLLMPSHMIAKIKEDNKLIEYNGLMKMDYRLLGNYRKRFRF